MEILWKMRGPLGIILLFQGVIFGVMAVVLRKMLLSDTLKAISRMKDAETDLGRKEEAMRQKMESHEQDFARQKMEAEQENEKRRSGMEQDLAKMKERMHQEAKVNADKIISEAQLKKEKMREQLEIEMKEEAVGFGGELFKLVVNKSVNDAINMAFIEELLEALADVDETSIHVEANEAEFVSSHNLDPGQKAKLEQLIADKFDVKVNIDETVDAKLLGGLIIKLGSLEIDGSVLNRFNEALVEIKKQV